MGKKSRRHKGGATVKEKKDKPTTATTGLSLLNDRPVTATPYIIEDPQAERRPYMEWYGRLLTLSYVQSKEYKGKTALCVGYDNATERLIVWPLEKKNEIVVDPRKCDIVKRYEINDCAKEVRERKAEERAAQQEECSICLEEPRAPVELPCSHRFCGSCIARLRSPREKDFELRCPNCRALMPALFEQMLKTANIISALMIKSMICSNPGCATATDPSRRHEPGGCLMTDGASDCLDNAEKSAVEKKDILPYLGILESFMQRYSQAATAGHARASKVKHHRDLMRRMVCLLLPDVQKLRRQYEGCLQVRSSCGGVDSQVEQMFMKFYGKPLLSPEEQRAALAEEPSMFPKDATFGEEVSKSQISALNDSADYKMANAMTLMVAKNLDASWLYIRSFGVHYDRVLNAFSNAVGQIANSDISEKMNKVLTDEMAVDAWAMCRLDAMEELFARKGAYGKYEAQEAFCLIQLLWNVVFAFVGRRQIQLDLFVRLFGQEYILREIEGAVDPKARQAISVTIGGRLRQVADYTDEFERPLLLLRPCANARYGEAYPDWCRLKESHEKEFMRCKCRRMAYCSPFCMTLHKDAHDPACAEALRIRKSLES